MRRSRKGVRAGMIGLLAGLALPAFGAAAETEEDLSPPVAEASGAGAETSSADPWEGFNRKVFGLNNSIDRAFFAPAARAYRATTPKAGRRGLRRFLANFSAPSTFINDILQGEFGRAGKTLSRFAINSTIGAGGFADPAAQMGIDGHKEDFGQTLAVWGVDSGPYLMLPFFGPSSPRDAFGSLIGLGFQPLTYVRTPPATYARFSLAGANLLAARENALDPLAQIEKDSLDYYSSFRSFYTQARAREIRNGADDFDALPEFDELNDIE